MTSTRRPRCSIGWRLYVDLDGVSYASIGSQLFTRDEIADARTLLPSIVTDDKAIEALVVIAAQLGVASLRAPLKALIVARAACGVARRCASG